MALKLKDAAVVDFETLPIRDRPRHPPAPVGVAIDVRGQKTRYLSWAHPNGKNNSTWNEARRALGEIWDSGRPVVFHNERFDCDVAEVHMGLSPLPWQRRHDTLPLLFLKDPRAPDFKLKPAAERLLGWKPEERDAVEDWLIENQPIRGVKLSRSTSASKDERYVGAYIAYAPAELVGKYACGDVDRTRALFDHLLPDIDRRKMMEAYDRERELNPILLEMERQGLRVDVRALERDIERYEATMEKLDDWLRRKLKAPGLNINSGPELAKALVAAGVCTEEDLGETEGGAVATNKDAIKGAVKDPLLVAVLRYRSQTKTSLGTFMKNWLAVALESGGYIYTTWNSTRSDKGGAKTGRFSSTPPFQNLPKSFEPNFKHHAEQLAKTATGKRLDELRDLIKVLPRAPFDFPPQPDVRTYILPYEDDEVLIDRDYSQQEPRILAHYEDGPLKEAYLANPWIDFHDAAAEELLRVFHKNYKRKIVKGFNLGIMYGMGVGLLAEKSGMPVAESKTLKDAILHIYPGLKEMYQEAKLRAKEGTPIRTWGGREYYCEEPRIIRGRIVTFDYKLVNILIQGSAADCTKQAMINFHKVKDKKTRLLLSVHDQLTASAPKANRDAEMEKLRVAMETIPFDVPMLSEGAWSDQNWGSLMDYDKKGQRCSTV